MTAKRSNNHARIAGAASDPAELTRNDLAKHADSTVAFGSQNLHSIKWFVRSDYQTDIMGLFKFTINQVAG